MELVVEARCHNLARVAWVTEPSTRAVHAGEQLRIGEWRCHGEARPWAKESVRHAAIELLHQGVHVREIGRQRVIVDATKVALHPAGDEFRMSSPSGRPQRSTTLYLRGDLADELGVRAPRVQPLTAHGALLHVELLNAREPLEVEEVALLLVHHLLGDTRREAASSSALASWRRVADEVQHELAARHSERVTLNALARAVGVSPFFMCRAFRAVTGETVHRHLVRLRLRAALYTLARDHHVELTEVALATGFSSHSHFTRAFRSEFGVCPSGVRDRRRNHRRGTSLVKQPRA